MKVDLNKAYRTRGGRSVFGMQIVPKNSAGHDVTFPVKGSIDMGKGKPSKYKIWMMDGKASIWGDTEHDLVEASK